MKRTLLFALPSAAGLLLAGVAFAQTPIPTNAPPAPLPAPLPTLTFPIPELGNCASQSDCKTYCDDPTHRDACYTFGQAHGLMTADQVVEARAYLASTTPPHAPMPGNGTPPSTVSTSVGAQNVGMMCRAYCTDPSHHGDCMPTPPTATSTLNDNRPVPSTIEQKFGCSTIAECKTLCATNPDKCPTTVPLPTPASSASNAGASVISGFAHFLGF